MPLEAGLAVEANQGIVHVDSSLFCFSSNDSGTVMPTESKEESIASDAADEAKLRMEPRR